jgi:hypothetical protein
VHIRVTPGVARPHIPLDDRSEIVRHRNCELLRFGVRVHRSRCHRYGEKVQIMHHGFATTDYQTEGAGQDRTLVARP